MQKKLEQYLIPALEKSKTYINDKINDNEIMSESIKNIHKFSHNKPINNDYER